MTDSETIARVLEATDQRRLERRRFLRTASAAGLAIGGSSLLAACGSGNKNKAPTPTPTSTGTPSPTPSATVAYTDADVLAFALNMEYLQANFYLKAVAGTALDATLTKGAADTDTGGTVTGGKKKTFTDSVLAEYAREIAADQVAHVKFLRTQLGQAVVAQPDINIDGGASGAFTAFARSAGIVGSSATFDPYDTDGNFLLAAFLLEDIGPTAYRGGLAYMTNAVLIEAAAGIHATEAYHAGLIRSTIYAGGNSTLIGNANKVSDWRDSLDGTTDDDLPITRGGTVDIVPTDSNGLTFQRLPNQVLNILFQTASSGVKKGGFFPNGIKGTIAST
ncbi:MAG: ferritin-like domain-containing protein [Sphingomonas sp.]